MKRFRYHASFPLFFVFVILGIELTLFSRFLSFVEGRPGVTLKDPVLALLPTCNLTIPIFILIYGTLFLALLGLRNDPARLFETAIAYIFVILLRWGAMSLIPLAPPPGMIILRDPLVELFGNGKPLTQDLFFSGHTALLYLLALCSSGIKRIGFLISTFFVAAFLLVQHVHYSIDVFSALFFTYSAFMLSKNVSPKMWEALKK